MEVKRVIPTIGDSKIFSPRTILVDEVGESSDLVYAPRIPGILWLGL